MKKIKFYGIGNEGNFNYYTFDRSEKTKGVLTKILKSALNVEWTSQEWKKHELIKKDFLSLKDKHELIGSREGARIDVFYGEKRMFLVVHCSQTQRASFNSKLLKSFYMPKSKLKKMRKK